MSHGNTASEKADDTGVTHRLRDEVGKHGNEEHEHGLRNGRVAKEAEPLEDQAADNASDQANRDREKSKKQEVSNDGKWRFPGEIEVRLELLDGVEKDDADDIIENSFSVDDREQLRLVFVADH